MDTLWDRVRGRSWPPRPGYPAEHEGVVRPPPCSVRCPQIDPLLRRRIAPYRLPSGRSDAGAGRRAAAAGRRGDAGVHLDRVQRRLERDDRLRCAAELVGLGPVRAQGVGEFAAQIAAASSSALPAR